MIELQTSMPCQFDVFISYALDTRPLALELRQAFEKNGIASWVDFKDLRPGENRQQAIQGAVEASSKILVLTRAGSSVTPALESEWQIVVTSAWADASKVVIPVIVGAGEPLPFLRSWAPLRVDPAARPLDWSSAVLDALTFWTNELPPEQIQELRNERRARFEQMARQIRELPRPERVL